MFAWCQGLASKEGTVRTAKHNSVSPREAKEMLKEGNQRFIGNRPMRKSGAAHLRMTLAEDGQNPFAAVLGCADSRCPLETLFDARPGDLFVLRNAGNAVTHAEGSIVGSIEFAIGALGTKLVLVLGHTKCGAMAGATSAMLGKLDGKKGNLESYLKALAPVAKQAKDELLPGSSVEQIAARAIKANVFNSIEKLLEYSAPLREKVAAGEVEVHGAIYQIVTGEVEFLGQHPRTSELLHSTRIAEARAGA